MSVHLSTASGAELVLSTVEATTTATERTCGACGRTTRRSAQVLVDNAACGELCGTCIAAALAIKLGSSHLAAGGSIDDLRYAVDQDLER